MSSPVNVSKRNLQAYIDLLYELISVEEGMVEADVIKSYQSISRLNANAIMLRIERLSRMIETSN